MSKMEKGGVGMANPYDLDSILEEAVARKRQRVGANAPQELKAQEPQPEEQPTAIPENVPAQKAVPPSEETPKEEKVAEPVVDEPTVVMPAVAPQENPAQDENDRTQVIDLPDRHRRTPSAPVAAPKANEPHGLDGQMDWSALGLEPEQEPPHEVSPEDVQKFKEARAEKARAFRLSGLEEDVEPEEESAPELESQTLDDYNTYEDTEAVRSDLEYRRTTATVSVVLTCLLEGLLVILAVVTQLLGYPLFEQGTYLIINASLLLVMLLVDHRLTGGGLANLLRGRPDTATVAVLPSIPVLIHTLLQLMHLTTPMVGDQVYASVAGLCLLGGTIGRYLQVRRTAENFRFVSYEGEKIALTRVEDAATAKRIGRTAVAEGIPYVVHARSTSFLRGFLRHAYADDRLDEQMRTWVTTALLFTVLPSVMFGLLRDPWVAFSAFTATLCLVCACAPLLASGVIACRTASKALRQGAFICGWEAAEQFGDTDAVTADAQDIFPPDSLQLHGIKTFRGARIDEVIMDAAAVSIAAGGPLAAVFRAIIADRVDILQEVDTLVYEQDMGVSGWVGGRRVLVGNRLLLKNHGVDVPSNAYEERYTVDGRKLVYLSTAGELSAMFVISYLRDDELAQKLQALSRCRMDLIIHSCDPNVTEELVCETLGLDNYRVAVMDAQASRAYVGLDAQTDEEEAILATDGRLTSTVAALVGCFGMRIRFTVARVWMWAVTFLTLTAGAMLMFAGTVPPVLLLLGISAISSLFSAFLPLMAH